MDKLFFNVKDAVKLNTFAELYILAFVSTVTNKDHERYCVLTNSMLSEVGISAKTATRAITGLAEKGLITYEIKLNKKLGKVERRIYRADQSAKMTLSESVKVTNSESVTLSTPKRQSDALESVKVTHSSTYTKVDQIKVEERSRSIDNNNYISTIAREKKNGADVASSDPWLSSVNAFKTPDPSEQDRQTSGALANTEPAPSVSAVCIGTSTTAPVPASAPVTPTSSQNVTETPKYRYVGFTRVPISDTPENALVPPSACAVYRKPANEGEVLEQMKRYCSEHALENPCLKAIEGELKTISENYWDYWSEKRWVRNGCEPITNFRRCIANWLNKAASDKQKRLSSQPRKSFQQQERDYRAEQDRLAEITQARLIAMEQAEKQTAAFNSDFEILESSNF